MSMVDRQKIRRSRTGLIAHDPARWPSRATPLFAPMYGDGTVYLSNMDGQGRAHLAPALPAGTLRPSACRTAISSTAARSWRTSTASRRGHASRLARSSKSTGTARFCGKSRHPDHHHDARRLRNGNVLLLCLRPLPADLARRVQGGLPGTEANGTIYADYLVEMTTGGRIVWEWQAGSTSTRRRYPMTFAGPPRRSGRTATPSPENGRVATSW